MATALKSTLKKMLEKVNSRFFFIAPSLLLHLVHFVKCWGIFLEFQSKGHFRKRKRKPLSYIKIYVHVFLFQTRIYRVAVKALCEKEKNNDTKKERTKKKKAKNKPMTERFLPEVNF